MNKHTFIIIFLSFAMAGCMGNSSVTPEHTPSALVSPPTAVATMTTTPIPPTATVIPITPTPTLPDLPLRTIEKRCVSEVDTPAKDFIKEGVIVLGEYPNPVGADILLLKPKADYFPLDLPKFTSGGVVSIDTRWFAYDDGETIYVLSSKGTIQSSYPRQEGWGYISRWLDSSRLIMDYVPRTPVGQFLIDPFKKEVRTLEPGFTDVYFYLIEASGWRYWKLVYDPTLTRVSYIRDSNGPEFALVDIESGKTLWSIKSFSTGLNDPPRWSPDGEKLIVIVSNEVEDDYRRFQLFIVDRDGHGTQWVDIPQEITFDKSGAEWSPDGRYIAFYGKSLYILDLQNHILFDYCGPLETYNPVFNKILWSPDSKQLIYKLVDMPAMIIDLESGLATTVSKDETITPLGWLRDEE